MTEPTRSRGRRESGWVRPLIWIVAVLVVVNVGVALVPGPSGKRSSALATAPDGFAAWAELERRNGVEVIALREKLPDADLPPGSTVVALDARLTRADVRALQAHVRSGGRVLDDRSVADVRRLQNARLADGDNAAYALELGGAGPLVFAEAIHGYGPSEGLGALPNTGKWALGLLGAAALLLMVARGKRFGPPMPESRPLAPPRVAYVDAVAAALAKTRDPAGAMEPIRAALDADPPKNDEAAIALAQRYAETIR